MRLIKLLTFALSLVLFGAWTVRETIQARLLEKQDFIVAWNKDGYHDIILGFDRNRFFDELELFPKPVKAQLMWCTGQSLPSQPEKR